MIKRNQLPQPEGPRPIDLYCPQLKCGGTVNILKCIYRCPKARVLRCPAYVAVYPSLINFEIEDKYKDKYGEVNIPIPLVFRKRRKRHVV